MDGECEIFWLAEAEMLSKLGANAQKLNRLLHATSSRVPRAVSGGDSGKLFSRNDP
jgi:hypothetical protein